MKEIIPLDGKFLSERGRYVAFVPFVRRCFGCISPERRIPLLVNGKKMN